VLIIFSFISSWLSFFFFFCILLLFLLIHFMILFLYNLLWHHSYSLYKSFQILNVVLFSLVLCFINCRYIVTTVLLCHYLSQFTPQESIVMFSIFVNRNTKVNQ
jgi:hypothetical protein